MGRSYHSLSTLATQLRVTRVARVTGLDRTGVEVACAVRPDGHILQVCNGKGWTWEQAEASALFEVAELYAAENQHVREYGPDEDGPESWSSQRLGGTNGGVIPLLSADRLGSDDLVKVPACAAICSPNLLGPSTVKWTSNGMGAAYTVEDALTHALDEAWERHALAVTLPQGWVPDAVVGRRVPVKLPKWTENGFELAVFDLSLDEGPWVIGALLYDLEQGPVPLAAGYAARAEMNLAIDAALLEAAQSRLTEIHAAREDVLTKPGAREVSAFWAELRKLEPMDNPPVRGEGPCWEGRDVAFFVFSAVPHVRVVKVLAPGLLVSELL